MSQCGLRSPQLPSGRPDSKLGSRPGSARSQRPLTITDDNWLVSTELCQPGRIRPCSAGGSRAPEFRRPQGRAGCSRSYADRALEEELRPMPLTPVPAKQGTPLECQIAVALGVEHEAYWPRLPQEVGPCEQGGRCCWRWLTRAALEQVAGEPLAHNMTLAEIVSKMRSDREQLLGLREWEAKAAAELQEAAFGRDRHERHKHERVVMEQEIKELRAQAEFLEATRRDNEDLHEHLAKARAREEEARQHATSLAAEKRMIVEGDLAAAQRRADQAEKEIARISKDKIDSRAALEDQTRQVQLLREQVESKHKENEKLRADWERLVLKRSGLLRKKRGRRR